MTANPVFKFSDEKNASMAVDAEARMKEKAQDLGWIGKAIGSKEHAPSNVAAVLGFLALLAMIGLFIWPPADGPTVWDYSSKILLPIVLSTLAYLFGRGTRD